MSGMSELQLTKEELQYYQLVMFRELFKPENRASAPGRHSVSI